jgi:hypothetical protein
MENVNINEIDKLNDLICEIKTKHISTWNF